MPTQKRNYLELGEMSEEEKKQYMRSILEADFTPRNSEEKRDNIVPFLFGVSLRVMIGVVISIVTASIFLF